LSWFITLDTVGVGQEFTISTSIVDDFAEFFACNSDCSASGTDKGEVFDVPGRWTFTETPLPATLPLFATGLGALGLLGWRRKRKAQAVG
jgi:hypothetical protein